MSGVQGLSDEDFAAILQYLDGDLDEQAMLQFELRLADEPSLSAGCRQIAVLDDAQRRMPMDPEPVASAALRVLRSQWLWALALGVLLLGVWAVSRR